MKEYDATYYSRYSEALAERSFLNYADQLEQHFSEDMLEERQGYDHFVCWRGTPDGKKIPYIPTTGQ